MKKAIRRQQNLRKEMRKIDLRECAAPGGLERWENLDFKLAERQTSKLQRRVAKACLHDARGQMSCLQERLIHSTSAKALAVRSVVSNKGRNTPGVDDVVWSTPEEKMQAVFGLRHRGYLSLLLRWIYIPKADGRRRALSIPTMKDRAMQALYKLALEPIAEATADQNSFGFRKVVLRRTRFGSVETCCKDARVFPGSLRGVSRLASITSLMRGCWRISRWIRPY